MRKTLTVNEIVQPHFLIIYALNLRIQTTCPSNSNLYLVVLCHPGSLNPFLHTIGLSVSTSIPISTTNMSRRRYLRRDLHVPFHLRSEISFGNVFQRRSGKPGISY